MIIKVKYLILLIVLLVVLVACGDNSEDNTKEVGETGTEAISDIQEEDSIEEIYNTVENYYDLVINGKFEESYDYLTEQSKSEYPLEQYIEYKEIQMEGYGLVHYEIDNVETAKDGRIIVFMDNVRKGPLDSKENVGTVPLYLAREDNGYKVELGDLFKGYTSISYDTLAFQNFSSPDRDFDLIVYYSEQSLEINPLNHMAHEHRAVAHSLAGNIDEAIEGIDLYLNSYIQMEENKAVLAHMYELKGMNLLGKHRSDEALEAYRMSLEIDPNNVNVREQVQWLESY